MRKLIIFLLFLVFTVVAIGVVGFGEQISLATEFHMGVEDQEEFATKVAAADQITVIQLPIVATFVPDVNQVFILHDGGVGSIYIVNVDNSASQAAVINAGGLFVTGSALLMWLFMLLMIIFLPKRRSKRSVKKIAENVVDDEMDSMPMPAPRRRSYDERPRGGAKRRPRRDYDEDDDDYDYE